MAIHHRGKVAPHAEGSLARHQISSSKRFAQVERSVNVLRCGDQSYSYRRWSAPLGNSIGLVHAFLATIDDVRSANHQAGSSLVVTS